MERKQAQPSKFQGLRELRDIPNAPEIFTESLNMLDGCVYWVSFGTALGLYRDEDFIPHDTDFDFSIITDDPSDLIDKFSDRFNYFRSIRYEDKQHQAAFQDDSGLVIDLSFFYRKGDQIYSYNDRDFWVNDFNDVLPRVSIHTKYGELPFPNKIEKYLESRYGDWRTPLEKKSIRNKL